MPLKDFHWTFQNLNGDELVISVFHALLATAWTGAVVNCNLHRSLAVAVSGELVEPTVEQKHEYVQEAFRYTAKWFPESNEFRKALEAYAAQIEPHDIDGATPPRPALKLV
jgi:hypothetical protein